MVWFANGWIRELVRFAPTLSISSRNTTDGAFSLALAKIYQRFKLFSFEVAGLDQVSSFSLAEWLN